MYYINNSEMICIPFTVEHARNVVSNVLSTSGLIMGLVASSMFVAVTNMVSSAINIISELSSEEIICFAFAFTTLMFVLILKVNAMLLDDIYKKMAYLTKENDMKTSKIEILSKQIDTYWEKVNKTA
jgi:hypothetical protein